MTKSARLLLLPGGWFQPVKYGIYLLLAANIILFLSEEWAAAQHTFVDGVSLREVIEAFTATIDTAAWVVLLLLFELETFVIPDRLLTGGRQWLLHGVRGLSYVVIVYAFYGYVSQSLDLYAYTDLGVADPCALAAAGASFLIGVNEYVALAPDNCALLAQGPELVRLANTDSMIVADTVTLVQTQRLAWTDVINAGDWLVVVFLLEADVQLQLRGLLNGIVLRISEISKAIAYSILLACAVYWGVAGDFLDFWDAFLWLVAFIFIELNVAEWQAETTAAADAPAGRGLRRRGRRSGIPG